MITTLRLLRSGLNGVLDRHLSMKNEILAAYQEMTEMDEERGGRDEIAILQRIDARESRKAAEREADRADYLEVMGAVVEALPDALIIADENGEIVLANTAAKLLFGYHKDQLIGQPVEKLIPERHRHSHVRNRTDYVLDPRQRAMGELKDITCQRRDGKEVSIGIMLAPIVTRRGVFTIAVVRRKRHG
jgi:PAS domain S-box-containing protein